MNNHTGLGINAGTRALQIVHLVQDSSIGTDFEAGFRLASQTVHTDASRIMRHISV